MRELPRPLYDRTMTAGRKILLVDDDVVLRRSLAEQLQLHEEFVPIEADTAAAALDRARGGDLDLILLDIGLPDMDGVDVTRALRRWSRL